MPDLLERVPEAALDSDPILHRGGANLGDESPGRAAIAHAMRPQVKEASRGLARDRPRGVALLGVLLLVLVEGGACTGESWKTFRGRAVLDLERKQAALDRAFALSSHPRFFMDQELGTIAFCSDGHPQVVARVAIVGSFSKTSGAWLWSWANSTVEAKLAAPIDRVRSVGYERGYSKLYASRWEAAEYEAWEMTAVAASILASDGAYRAPGEDGDVYLLLFDVAPASESGLNARCT